MDRGIKELSTISASRLNVFKTCHRKFYYEYVIPKEDRPDRTENVAALMGTALHKAIEDYYRDGKSATGTFQRIMSETIDEWENNARVINGLDYYPRAMKVGKQILTDFDWTRFEPQELEYHFTLPFPNAINPIVNITGYIDMITLAGEIIDHKSNTYAPVTDELAHSPQFILYRWAYEEIFGFAPFGVYWNHLRTAKLIPAQVEHNYQFKLDQLTLDIQAMLVNTHYPRKTLDSVCKTKCSFYTQCYGEKANTIIEPLEAE